MTLSHHTQARPWAHASLALCLFLSSLGTSITNVALPTFAKQFAASFQTVQWIVLAYLLAVTSLVVGVGKLSDIIGRRPLLLGGIFLFTMASGLCGAAPTLPLLIAARALQGTGAAIMMALSLAYVGETVARKKAGRAMGMMATLSALGTALGPSLGGFLIAGPGWRAIFFVNLPLGMLAMLIAHRQLPADRLRPKGSWASFDAFGTLILAATLVAYALAMTIGQGNFGLFNIALLFVATLGIAVFLRIETRAKSPLIRPTLFHDGALRIGLGTSAIVTTVMMATLVVGPFYLSNALGLDAALVGLLLSVGPIVVALSGVPAGQLTDRYGAERMTVVGLVALGIGCACLSMTPRIGVLGYVACIVIITLGYSAFQTANNTIVMMRADPDNRGVISGLLSLSRNLGLVTGASFMGAVFALGTGARAISVARPDAIIAGLQTTFAVAVVLIGIALAMAIAGRGRRSRRSAPNDTSLVSPASLPS